MAELAPWETSAPTNETAPWETTEDPAPKKDVRKPKTSAWDVVRDTVVEPIKFAGDTAAGLATAVKRPIVALGAIGKGLYEGIKAGDTDTGLRAMEKFNAENRTAYPSLAGESSKSMEAIGKGATAFSNVMGSLPTSNWTGKPEDWNMATEAAMDTAFLYGTPKIASGAHSVARNVGSRAADKLSTAANRVSEGLYRQALNMPTATTLAQKRSQGKAVQTGLSGEFLQRLGYAADQSGVSVETLTGGVKKLTIAIGKGDEKPFAELGLTLTDLLALSPDQQFLKVAEAIGKIPTAAGRAAAAVKVFGKSGIEMTGLFAGGLNDINKLLADAKRIGIGVSEEDLKRAAAADDAIQRMKASFGALIDKVSVVFAPALTDIADKITSWIAPLNLVMDKFNAMPEKFTFLGDVIVASFDVAIEHVAEKWQQMIVDLTSANAKFAATVARVFVAPATVGADALNIAQGGLQQPPGGPNAQQRLDALMQRFNAPQGGANERGPNQFVGPQQGFAGVLANFRKQQADQAKVMGDMLGQGLSAGGFLLNIGKGLGNAVAGNLKPRDTVMTPAKQSSPQFAGAMQKGSAEAFSTILASRGGKDPNVMATEKQTQQLLKGLKPKPQFVPQFAPEFA